MGRGAKVSGDEPHQSVLGSADESATVHTRRRRSARVDPMEMPVPVVADDTATVQMAAETPAESVGPTEDMTDDPTVLEIPLQTGSPTVTAAFDEEELRRILCVPKMKRQVPTLVRFREDGQVPVRSVLVDIGEPVLRAGWEYYRSTMADASVQRYMELVYGITQTRLPRMYRVVAELDLTR